MLLTLLVSVHQPSPRCGYILWSSRGLDGIEENKSTTWQFTNATLVFKPSRQFFFWKRLSSVAIRAFNYFSWAWRTEALPVRYLCRKYTGIPSSLILPALYWQPVLKMSKLIRALLQPRSKCCASAFVFLTSLIIHCCASGEYVATREAVSVLKADVTVSNVSFSYLTDSGPLGVTLSPSKALLTGPTTIAVLNNSPPGVSHASNHIHLDEIVDKWAYAANEKHTVWFE